MKNYSLYAALLLAVLLGVSLSSFRVAYDMPSGQRGNLMTKHVFSSPISGKLFGGSLSGTYPAGQGFHSYGTYTLDLSNIPNGGAFTIRYSAENNPNRFTVQDGVGNSFSSHNSSANPDPYNGWIGYYSGPGPWGQNGITGPTDGSFSVVKVSGRTYVLQVETVTNSLTDYWSVTY